MVNNMGENRGVMAGTINGNVEFVINSSERKVPTLLPKLIEILSKLDFEKKMDPIIRENNKAYTIEEKIKHNHVQSYEEVIKKYYGCFHICESALATLEEVNYGTKKKILNDIETLYGDIKRNKFSEFKKSKRPDERIHMLQVVQYNSDEIIDEVKKNLKYKIEDGYNYEDFTMEDISLCLDVFLVYAFGECKILERPQYNNDNN